MVITNGTITSTITDGEKKMLRQITVADYLMA